MRLILSILILVTFSSLLSAQEQRGLREVNQIAAPPETSVIAIVGATLIDGRGGPAVPDSVVLVRGAQITAVGKRTSIGIPPGAELVDANGLTPFPGPVDSHFHIDGGDPLTPLYPSYRITSHSGPGQGVQG